MALIIVTGGTTGAADGTLVSSGNKITFTALDTPVSAHMRSDSGYYSPDQTVTLPAEVSISFNGGAYVTSGTNPNSVGVDIEDVNYPISLKQTIAATGAASTFDTTGTYSTITALADVTGLLGTRSSSGTSVDLSWTAVTNRTYYQIQRDTASDFSTASTLTSTATATTYSDTGRTAGTTYYYRVKALGTGRYSDSASWTTYSAFPQGRTAFSFAVSSAPIAAVEGPDGNVWVTLSGTSKIARVTPEGTVSEFACTTGTTPVGICVLGGNIWYACSSGHIVKISTFSGTPTQTAYSITAAYDIVGGPDGYLYVTSYGTTVRKVDPADGTVVASGFGTSGVATLGGGGSLRWITSDGTDLFISDRTYGTTGAIVKCTTAGTLTATVAPDTGADLMCLCWDGTYLYVAGQGTGKIYRVTNGGTQTFASNTVHASSQVTGVTVGPDGRVYTSGYNASYANIYSMPAGSSGGSFTTEAALTGAGNYGLCKHSNDSVWALEYTSSKISRYVK